MFDFFRNCFSKCSNNCYNCFSYICPFGRENKEKDERNEIYCPHCHKKIKLINKNLEAKVDDSNMDILDVKLNLDRNSLGLNKSNLKQKLIFNEYNNFDDLDDNKNYKIREMTDFGNNKLNELKEKEIEEKNLSIEQKQQLLEKRDKELKAKENKINEEEKKLKQKVNNFEEEKNREIIKLKELEESLNKREKELKQKEDLFNNEKINFELEKENFQKEKKLFDLSKLPTIIGLQNIGATCYMNATLQALSHTNKFTEFFLTKYKYNPNDPTKKMSNEMYKVLTNLWSEEKKKGDYPPYDFKNTLSQENPLFAGIAANDSKDLINFLLERFHQELNLVDKNKIINNGDENVNQMDEMQTFNAFLKEYFQSNQSVIVETFYGIVETKSKCGGCNITKYNFQIYSFLEFPLKEVNNYMFQMGRRFSLINNDGTNPDINLYECFDYFQKIDIMTGQNQMFCNICNGNRDTFYGTNIYSLPNYLIINLNRGKGGVYSCNVIFPEVLNLWNYVSFKDGGTAMRLYAVICHYGPSSMSGHFIAYCRHRVTNKWYKYNDSIVTECTQPKEYTNGMPYILFYKAV